MSIHTQLPITTRTFGFSAAELIPLSFAKPKGCVFFSTLSEAYTTLQTGAPRPVLFSSYTHSFFANKLMFEKYLFSLMWSLLTNFSTFTPATNSLKRWAEILKSCRMANSFHVFSPQQLLHKLMVLMANCFCVCFPLCQVCRGSSSFCIT